MNVDIPIAEISSQKDVRLLCFPCSFISATTNKGAESASGLVAGEGQERGYPKTKNPSDEINQKNFSNHFVGLCNFINGFSTFKFRARSSLIFLVRLLSAFDEACSVLVSYTPVKRGFRKREKCAKRWRGEGRKCANATFSAATFFLSKYSRALAHADNPKSTSILIAFESR